MLARLEEKLQRLTVDSSLQAPASLRALLSGLIDYAGLYPPAGLSMPVAVGNYARYVAGPDAWALARFVLPVSRFEEFEKAVDAIRMIEPWGITALLGASPEAELAEIDKFNHRNQGRAAVDAVEVKAATSDEICHIRAYVRGSITAYFEISPAKAAELLPTIKAIHARAKIRTGGVTPDAFPSSETVASFILECAKHEVAFKATAGLHHPIRCTKPLTYEANAPTVKMHGFLNVFIAAVVAWAGGKTIEVNEPHMIRPGAVMQPPFPYSMGGPDDGSLLRILKTVSPFLFEETGIQEPYPIPNTVVRSARQNFAISFGSCSFEEPLADLRQLKFL